MIVTLGHIVNMDLWEWLKREGIRPSQFAKTIELDHSALSHYRAGRKRPSLDTIEKIVEATGGEVTAADFARRKAA